LSQDFDGPFGYMTFFSALSLVAGAVSILLYVLLFLLMHPALSAAHALLPDAYMDIAHLPRKQLPGIAKSPATTQLIPGISYLRRVSTSSIGLKRRRKFIDPREIWAGISAYPGDNGRRLAPWHLRLWNDGNGACPNMGFSEASYSRAGAAAGSVKMVA
jgi:hypothetical protein